MQRICVFCGSNAGVRPAYAEVARTLAGELVQRGIGVVYGGGRVGLMGALADAALAAGGQVTGVIPDSLQRREVAHPGITDLRVVGTMHERKALMADLADGFIALPGGFGTLDEFFEILTWAQLQIHTKPCGILNAEGYFDPLLAFVDHAVEQGFVAPAHRDMIVIEGSVPRLLDRLVAYRAPAVGKWLDREVR
jgi:uncharacterized protein (TIGR00730 family)